MWALKILEILFFISRGYRKSRHGSGGLSSKFFVLPNCSSMGLGYVSELRLVGPLSTMVMMGQTLSFLALR